ncbi:MAG: GYD domain-containing protein [Acetobacteraceae bacterium]|nr:GYD domain-containing protein [Acetobacteraceae bacterium]
MPKFLIRGSYTPEGMKGLLKDKASGREREVAAACEAMGGKLDSLHYALGDDDVFVLVDMPSHVQMASLAVAVGTSGLVATRTVPLLTVAEMDRALGEPPKYRPPGG